MTGSKNLIQLPNLSTAKNFEELIVEGCKSLQKIPESLKGLFKLKKLNASHCDSLKGIMSNVDSITSEYTWQVLLSFPYEKSSMGGIEDLSIESQILVKLLGIYGCAEHISFRSKQQIPDELLMMEESTSHHLTSEDSMVLHSLNIMNFRYRESRVPFTCISFQGFESVKELKLVNLKIEEIPDGITSCQNLEKLDLSGNDFVYLPNAIGDLRNLKYLSLHNCRRIKSLPRLSQVKTLKLSECVNLRSFMTIYPRETYCLLELWLDNCKHVRSLSESLSGFTKLTYLDLSRNNILTLPSSITKLSSLETLYLNNCKNLISVEELPHNVKYLYAHGCDSLETVSLSPNHSIKHLDLIHCPSLNQEEHEHLMDLFIHDGQSQEVMFTVIDLFFLFLFISICLYML